VGWGVGASGGVDLPRPHSYGLVWIELLNIDNFI